jgi:hypothetical protein
VHPSPLYKGPPWRKSQYTNSTSPSSTASSYHLPIAPAPALAAALASLSLPRGSQKGCVGDENHHRDTPSCCRVSRSLFEILYFRISAGNGVPGVIMVAVRVRVCGGAACAVLESLLQDFHDLEVGYVVFDSNACAGA